MLAPVRPSAIDWAPAHIHIPTHTFMYIYRHPLLGGAGRGRAAAGGPNRLPPAGRQGKFRFVLIYIYNVFVYV